MLSSIHIENIAVIKNLDIDFIEGLTVFTGETGAGKSIIIDSIGLIAGAKFSKDMIRSGESAAEVSAIFTGLDSSTLASLEEIGVSPDEDGCVFIRRTVAADGKNSVKINGRSVPSSIHKAVGSLLIDIHGQHDNRILLDPSTHVGITDRYSELEEKLSDYRSIYDKMRNLEREMNSLTRDEREKNQRIDMLTYQIDEISAADLQPEEDVKLENELRILKSAKQLSKSANTVYRALYKNEKGNSAARLVEIARASLDSMAEVLEEASKYSDRLYDIQYELEAIAKEALSAVPGGDDPEKRIVQIEDRLDTIRKLKRKYGSTVSEVLEFFEKANAELQSIKGSDKLVAQLAKQYEEHRSRAEKAALEISSIRSENAAKLSREVCSELAFLDMDKVKFGVKLDRSIDEQGRLVLSPNGCDKAEFMISTNPGEPMRPLARIASGGELSRIMLALKCVLMDAEGIPTLIFDEVDTGVSGKTAQKIGIKLRQLSETAQVFCITHSAQIAAFASDHIKIRKTETDGRSFTETVSLDYDQRVDELSRIIGGASITYAVRKSASELIEYSRNYFNHQGE